VPQDKVRSLPFPVSFLTRKDGAGERLLPRPHQDANYAPDIEAEVARVNQKYLRDALLPMHRAWCVSLAMKWGEYSATMVAAAAGCTQHDDGGGDGGDDDESDSAEEAVIAAMSSTRMTVVVVVAAVGEPNNSSWVS
jgi:hypothetical protein